MRDLLPEEASARRSLARRVLDAFALWGYSLVTPPVFEFADVLERGLGARDPADVLRFVEPESGEVAALRPDVTPQIARIIATRLYDRPPPHRLSYEASVMRGRSGRARKHRQIPQAGFELVGLAAQEGDLEALAVAAAALGAAGLERFTIDLGDAGVARALLEGESDATQECVMEALARKDEAELARLAGGRLAPLAHLHGGRDALEEGLLRLAGTPAEAPARRLAALFDAASARGLGSARLTADLGEARGFAYYTGPIFHAYAPGPGEPVGAGGRYDDLLARFGTPAPAVGFALDLDCLALALRAAGASHAKGRRVVVVGASGDARVGELRSQGVAAVAVEGAAAAHAYARAWGYTHVLDGEELSDVV
jgi:ATP phosphoribosyltransferase regulatory subunit